MLQRHAPLGHNGRVAAAQPLPVISHESYLTFFRFVLHLQGVDKVFPYGLGVTSDS